MTVSRQYARILDRIERGLCPRCPTGRLLINPATRQLYRLCVACKAKKNDARRGVPRHRRAA